MTGKILIADAMHDAGMDRLRELGFTALLLDDLNTEAERQAAFETSDVLMVRVFLATPELMDRMKRLKAIVKHGAGVDNIDIPAATERRIPVINTPGGAAATAVAEGAVGLMLGVLRQIRDMDERVRTGRYGDRTRIALGDLWGKTLGLVGFGKISRVVTRICGAGFDMTVHAYDPFVPAETMAAANVRKVETLAELMALSDVVSVHVPLEDATFHLIDAEAIAAMQRHAVLVNTSRGGLVDEAALIAALQEGRIAGAGLDVFEKEPPDIGNPLFKLSNVALSPHVAGVTRSGMQDMALNVARVIDMLFKGERPSTVLNGEIWETRRR